MFLIMQGGARARSVFCSLGKAGCGPGNAKGIADAVMFGGGME